jgi:hypothetical protein
MDMVTAFTVLFSSILGIIALFLRRVRQVFHMGSEELAGVLQTKPPLLTHLWEIIVSSIQILWHRFLREKILTFIVKKISQIRIIVLHMEQSLFRLTARMRDHSKSNTNKIPSEYWRDMRGWRKTVHWSKKKDN